MDCFSKTFTDTKTNQVEGPNLSFHLYISSQYAMYLPFFSLKRFECYDRSNLIDSKKYFQ